jgi:acyl carrier protein
MNDDQGEQVCDAVKKVIIEVLDLDDDTMLRESTTAEEIPGWDSLQHVRILLALERRFKFRWQEEEVKDLKNVGDLFNRVLIKIGAK